ncbi:putative C2 domain-containing protein [Helianthus annuus]|uniref:C2 domain-containing protein n=1 Tax=Helianthus annuus TaxID=4232 RepID=A0A251VKY0_HELAN|nr:putative C2 domain-containing protein [Helianthus annuus]KAJ0484442.1 putative C2 domain-containing protein [Helianthus annuus]KAJ0654995.1 putative C2 domain-containing protein [Helianthus annuus]KAJ0658711.1 putative C2 domain-containing protein [Helianthus annuus]KAJ0838911.1 putative C2 domain-containing protein [Helianthus annuus]
MKQPAGILNVKVIKAELRWASDVFAMLKLTDEKLPYKKTTVTLKTMNPEWNEEFNLVVKDLEVQVLEIILFSWESEEVWSQIHAHTARTTPLLSKMTPTSAEYIQKLLASRSFWKKSQVTPKMLLQTKRTTRVTNDRTPPGPATSS